jgi:site-specific recombinase
LDFVCICVCTSEPFPFLAAHRHSQNVASWKCQRHQSHLLLKQGKLSTNASARSVRERHKRKLMRQAFPQQMGYENSGEVHWSVEIETKDVQWIPQKRSLKSIKSH